MCSNSGLRLTYRAFFHLPLSFISIFQPWQLLVFVVLSLASSLSFGDVGLRGAAALAVAPGPSCRCCLPVSGLLSLQHQT